MAKESIIHNRYNRSAITVITSSLLTPDAFATEERFKRHQDNSDKMDIRIFCRGLCASISVWSM